MSVPRVSILMTVYNAAPFLRESVDSLIAQDFKDWELIALEHGSTDDSAAILAEYKDPRVKVFTLPKNIGRTPGLRYAFDQAQGEYIAVLDADDVAYPTRLGKQITFMDSHPDVVLVGSWAHHIDEKSQIFNTWAPPTNSDELYESLGWIDPIVHSSAMYRRQTAVDVGGYPAQYIYSQDFGLILKMAVKGKVAMMGEYLCKLRILKSSMSLAAQYRIEVAYEGLLLMKYAGEVLSLTSQGRYLNRCAIAKYEIRYGIALIRQKAIFKGLEMILRALCRQPSIVWKNSIFRPRFQAS